MYSVMAHLQLINCVGIVVYCNRQVHRDVLITLYMAHTYDLVEYITLCLDSTNKVETVVHRAQIIYCIMS